MVLVIGATGFIGMYTVDYLLRQGEPVIATGRNTIIGEKLENMGAEFVSLDITRPDDFEKLPNEGVSGVILLAGLLPANIHDETGDEHAADYFSINVIGTINVLEYCRKHGIRKVIGCSSYSDVAKSWKKGVALTEEEPRNFAYVGDHAVYVISKNAANDVMEHYNQQFGMQCAWFRFPPVYGVGPHGSIYVDGKLYKSAVQTFIEKAQDGQNIEIWGDPSIERDIVYVKDVARAFYMALNSEHTYGLYNMTSGMQLTLEEQAKVIIDVFGHDRGSKIVYRPEKANNTSSFLFSMQKAKKDFRFEPEFTSYETMMRDYKAELDSDRWNVLINRHEE